MTNGGGQVKSQRNSTLAVNNQSQCAGIAFDQQIPKYKLYKIHKLPKVDSLYFNDNTMICNNYYPAAADFETKEPKANFQSLSQLD